MQIMLEYELLLDELTAVFSSVIFILQDMYNIGNFKIFFNIYVIMS